MATVAELHTHLLAAIAAFPGPPTRLGSDMRRDLERVAPNTTRFALSAFVAGESAKSSNDTRQVVLVKLAFLHCLADPADERAFSEAALDTMLAALARASWWRALASVYGVVDGALPEIEIDRVGDVVRLEVQAQLALK